MKRIRKIILEYFYKKKKQVKDHFIFKIAFSSRASTIGQVRRRCGERF